MALKLNNENFDEVMGKGMPVVIDFWATWCGPCRMVSPIIDELAEEDDGKAPAAKISSSSIFSKSVFLTPVFRE